MQTINSISDNLNRVRERISRAAERSKTAASGITLVVVSKRVDAARVREAIQLGAGDLGENYVQEAEAKIDEVGDRSAHSVRWHHIGHLQSNKARDAVRLFDLIQGLDSVRTAEEIGKQSSKIARLQPVLLEVNLAPEIPGRAGVLSEQVGDIAAQIGAMDGVDLQGLMTVAPPNSADDDVTRTCFRKMRAIFETLPAANRRILSMGMSGDFETAIEEGATMVRVGSAIFGARK